MRRRRRQEGVVGEEGSATKNHRRGVVGKEGWSTRRRRGGIGEEEASVRMRYASVMININVITKNKLGRLIFSRIDLIFCSA